MYSCQAALEVSWDAAIAVLPVKEPKIPVQAVIEPFVSALGEALDDTAQLSAHT